MNADDGFTPERDAWAFCFRSVTAGPAETGIPPHVLGFRKG